MKKIITLVFLHFTLLFFAQSSVSPVIPSSGCALDALGVWSGDIQADNDVVEVTIGGLRTVYNYTGGGRSMLVYVPQGLTITNAPIVIRTKNVKNNTISFITYNFTYAGVLPAKTITGSTSVCQGQNALIYSVPAIENATSYQWTLPSGAIGTSTTNSISVDYGLSAVSGTITVKGVNSCGAGVSSTLAITVNPLPSNAGAITGATSVCPSAEKLVYSVSPIKGATSYEWTIPNGVYGIQADGNYYAGPSISTATPSLSSRIYYQGVSFNLTVKGVNSCGAGVSSSLEITVNPVAGNGYISGTATVCQGQNNVVYTVTPMTNAISYEWSLPSGATGTSTTNSIAVNYGFAAVSGYIFVKGVTSNCGAGTGGEDSFKVTVIPSTTAGAISGAATVCQGQNTVVDSVPASANASSYQWSLPSGATGISTTNSITVNYGSTAVSGNITAKIINASGCSGPASTLAINVNPLPSGAGAITGPATVCAGTDGIYSVPVIANATSYLWTYTLYGGGSRTTTTNSMLWRFGFGYKTSGNLTVKGVNSCGAGATSTFEISVNDSAPSSAGTISGVTTVCKGQNNVLYTVPVIANATSYQWTLPSGATGTSTTNSINVNYGTTAVSGNIIVKGINPCGAGVTSTLAITINPLPSNAGAITGTATVCQGQNSVIYSVPAIANVTSYQWTLPSGASGTSTTNSITVDYGLAAVSGNITVKGVNSCGAGVASVFAVNVINCSLPSNNFKLEVTDPTCQTKANGKLKITATAGYNYTATMDGVNYTFTNNILDIANLAPKTYTICIKVPALNNYTQCFEFTVKSAPGLTAKTRMDTKGNKTTANVSIESGTAPYTVEINGKTIDVTFENQLNISVQNGDLLEIKTSIACEGKIRERVSLSNDLMAYPNPTSNFVELFIPNTFQKKYVMIQMVDNGGKSVVNREFKVIDNSIIIPMENLSEGLYIINVQLETLQTVKIIKK